MSCHAAHEEDTLAEKTSGPGFLASPMRPPRGAEGLDQPLECHAKASQSGLWPHAWLRHGKPVDGWCSTANQSAAAQKGGRSGADVRWRSPCPQRVRQ